MAQQSARDTNRKNLGIPFLVLSLPGLPFLPLAAAALFSCTQCSISLGPKDGCFSTSTTTSLHNTARTWPLAKNSINGELIFYNFFYFPPKSACSPVLSVPPFCYIHVVKSNSIITVNRNLTVMFKGKYYDALLGGAGFELLCGLLDSAMKSI